MLLYLFFLYLKVYIYYCLLMSFTCSMITFSHIDCVTVCLFFYLGAFYPLVYLINS